VPEATSHASPSVTQSASSRAPRDLPLVCRDQFLAVLNDSNVRSALKSKELQGIIRAIDAAPDREQALERYLQGNQDFAVFVGETLTAAGFAEDVP